MEVCGRYHHFMPILVRILHPDAFLVWCLTHVRAVDAQSRGGAYGAALTSVDLNLLLSLSTLQKR